MQQLQPTRVTRTRSLRAGLFRAWDSDLAWSYRRSPVAIVASLTTALILLLALLAPWVAPQDAFDPGAIRLDDGFLEPMQRSPGTGMLHVLGTDSQGRDLLSAILYGSRVSLLVGFAAVGFSMALGVTLGLIAGFIGGRTDAVIMRIADVQLSFPAILIALLVFGVGRGLIPPSRHEEMAVIVLIVAIGLSHWAQYARTVRGSTMVEKGKEYVQAARVMGRRPFAIMGEHVLPNVVGPVLVIATINLALAVIEEATLSFLGVGVPPTQPSLGTLIRVGQQFLFSGEWWILLFPSLALIVLALAINLLGDWLRDALNPRLK
ncbi:MAG: ABC transporter permease [Hyphomicrobiaceae bacterium]|nr:ABC transporter permease [Hyphomicrobiaceae bacterium]